MDGDSNNQTPDVRPDEPAQQPEEPAQQPEEPAQQPEEPAQQPEEPVQQTEEPAQQPEEPVQQPEEPVQQPEEPVQQPEEPVQKPEEPAQQPDEPSQQPDEPAQQPDEPTQQPEEPAQQPDEPTQQPDEPVQQTDEPSQQPDEPAQQPDEPAQQPDEPSQQPDEPVQQPEEPVQKPEEPVQQPDEPAQQPDEPTQQPDEPTQQPEEPAQKPDEPPKATPVEVKTPAENEPETGVEPAVEGNGKPANGSPSTAEEELGYKPIMVPELVVKQSVPVVEGNEAERASPLMLPGQPISFLRPGVLTLHDTFLHGLEASGGGPCVGWRPSPDSGYEWLDYHQVLDRSQQFGSGLLHQGAVSEPSQFVGIFAQNRPEWKIAEQACNSFSMVVVPLYDTLGPDSIQHIITQCELKILVVDNVSKAQNLLSGVKDNKFSLQLIILMEEITEEVKTFASDTDVKLIGFKELEEIGKANLKDFVPPKPEDLHTICYTSGTTGLPKGVMLTHGNLVANMAGVFALGETTYLDMTHNEVYISYLPLAHVFERLVAAHVYFIGGRIGFFQGDIKLLLNDIAELKPTIFAMVPRLMNKIYDKIWQGANQSVIKKALLNKAFKSKLAKLKKGIVTRKTFWDKIVFKKVQNLVGGRVKYCITGAAPISLEVINFMRCALGVDLTEGYGQTEAAAAICVTVPGDFQSGSVGTPAVCNTIKLVDVPEKNYFAKDGKGEICAKGTNIFRGYYKNEEKTREALDEDGWLHTGDVGMWLPSGALKIIDRKKNIFKLAQGEYIAPEKIEQVLVQSPAIAQVFIHGESIKASLVGVCIPDVETFPDWCKGKGHTGSMEELCANDQVKALLMTDLWELGKQRGLKSFELPKRIYLSTELFSIENDLLTPTFKSRRIQIQKRYEAEIEKMYNGLD